MGKSIKPLLDGTADKVYADDETISGELFNETSVRMDDWQAIHNAQDASGVWKLFNLASDLGIIGRQKLFAQDLTGHPAEALIASTVRIEGKQSNNKISVDTGFMYDFLFRKIAESRYWSITAIVTNKHVVKDTVSGNFLSIK
jgi:hypothetical protein